MGLFQTTVIVLLAHHVFDLNKVIDYFVPVYVLLAALVIASYALHFQMHPRKEHPPVFRLAKKQPEKKKDLGGRPDFNGVWKTTRSEKYAEFLTAQGVNGIAARIAANATHVHTIVMDNEIFDLTIAGPAGKFNTRVAFDGEPVETRMKAKVFHDSVKSEGNMIIYTKESRQDNMTIVATRTLEDGGRAKKISLRLINHKTGQETHAAQYFVKTD